jgi:hypothetical protein
MNRRYMIVNLGSSKGIDGDLNNVADSETGVHFVDGSGIFIGTFFSPYSKDEIQSFLVDRPAFMLFDISDKEKYGVNLPSKYHEGLFPEVGKIMTKLIHEDTPVDITDTEEEDVESLTDVNDIIDKLEKNNFNRSSLTKKELDILDNC